MRGVTYRVLFNSANINDVYSSQEEILSSK